MSKFKIGDKVEFEGCRGTITKYHNEYNLFKVEFEDGKEGAYNPDTLKLIRKEGKIFIFRK